MFAEILATGDEIRTGAVIDSNSAYIAELIEQEGIKVNRITCVGDDTDMLVSAFREIATRADIAIVTGGLGPTEDDLTAGVAAIAAETAIVLDKTALNSMEKFFKNIGREMTYSNKKQAMLPYGAKVMKNSVGTAPGFMLKIGKCYFFCLPGVPLEMKVMMEKRVLPEIANLYGNEKEVRAVKTISSFGLTESATGERLSGFSEIFPKIKLGLCVKFPEIHIKLYASGDNKKAVNDLLEKGCDEVIKRLKHRVISRQGLSMEAAVGRLLSKKGVSISVAESCTGGLLSNMLTNVPGSSDYFLFSGVTYSNEAKIRVLKVSKETITKYGAVHEETAKQMARGARELARADYAVSTTGIAGPGGGADEKPVGTVCIGIAGPERTEGFRLFFPFRDRVMNKKIFAVSALNLLRKELS